MIIGFTGTQKGMSELQKKWLEEVAYLDGISQSYSEFHHGDCIGADAEAHDIFYNYMKIIIHPPIIKTKRAFKSSNIILPTKPYLERNKDIVAASEIMIAMPAEKQEQLRSGTWSTIRYAKKIGKKLIICYPDGSRDRFNYAHTKL